MVMSFPRKQIRMKPVVRLLMSFGVFKWTITRLLLSLAYVSTWRQNDGSRSSKIILSYFFGDDFLLKTCVYKIYICFHRALSLFEAYFECSESEISVQK